MLISVEIFSFKILIQKLSTAHHLNFECFCLKVYNRRHRYLFQIVRMFVLFQFILFKTTFNFLPFNFPFDNNELGPSETLNICASIDACCFDFFLFHFFSPSFFNFEEYYCARHVMIYFICQLYLTCFHLNSSYWTSTLSFANIFCPFAHWNSSAFIARFVRSLNWKS